MAKQINLGRIVGSRFYTGAAKSASEIQTILAQQGVTKSLEGDCFFADNGDFYQYTNKVWEFRNSFRSAGSVDSKLDEHIQSSNQAIEAIQTDLNNIKAEYVNNVMRITL